MAKQATVVGSGPNGLAAAVALARAGYDVRVLEAADTVGGGVRTAELTLPGFHHDVCSAVHPAALSSPFFRAFGLRERIEWITPEISFAQPLDGGRAAIAWRDLDRTADGLGRDARAWRAVVRPLSTHLDSVVDFTGSQLLRVPRHPITTVRFGLRALQLGSSSVAAPSRPRRRTRCSPACSRTRTPRCPRSGPPHPDSSSLAHAHTGDGWAYPRGGAQRIADALVADLRAHGGEIETGHRVHLAREPRLGRSGCRRPAAARHLAAARSSPTPTCRPRYARAIRRYAYGPAAAKVDFALDGPDPVGASGRRALADRAPRRHPRRGGGERERRRPGRGDRPSVRARGAAVGARPDARAGRASRCCGPTSTCPRTRRSTRPNSSRVRSSGSHRDSAIASSPRTR